VSEQVFAAPSWPEKIRQELAPSHGRTAGSLRTAAAATLAAVILLVLQTPIIAPGIYLIFLVSYDVPYLTFKRSVQELFFQCVGVGVALLLIEITGNDPMVRVLGIAGFTFLSGFLLCASTVRIVAMNLGIFPILTLSLWEMHLPAEQLVHLSMWPIATGFIAVGCKVTIEYLFTNRDPQRALKLEIKARLDVVRLYFESIARNASPQDLKPVTLQLTRYAFAGQGKMLALFDEVQFHAAHLESGSAISDASIPIPRIARLLDLAAAFSRRFHSPADERQQAKAIQIVAMLDAIEAGTVAELDDEQDSSSKDASLLDECIQVLHNIAAERQADRVVPHSSAIKPKLVRPKAPWFRPDAWTNPDYLTYAFKLSLCATICYVIYNALAWPGITTATLTVLIAGLSSTGATNQKMIFRFLGALIGGVILGIGCIVFVYPFADTALPFLISVACVSFLGAWIARSAHLGYVGLQIVFAFYLVVFQEYSVPMHGMSEFGPTAARIHGFAAPTQMTIGRDRVLGILLALLVMWVIFHRLHPERTVVKMRQGLARLLRIHAKLLPQLQSASAVQIAAMREEANQVVLEVRNLAEAIPFELDQHVARDLEICEEIQEAIANTGSLLLHLVTATPQFVETGSEQSPSHSLLNKISDGLRDLSLRLSRGSEEPQPKHLPPSFLQPDFIASCPARMRSALNAYGRLESQCLKIET
jgi:multidrug resistance protein MdtO